MTRRSVIRPSDGPRHSAEWYDQTGELVQIAPGDRLFIACEGGPSNSRVEVYPPRLEIPEHGGTYVLVDEDERWKWRYVFVPDECLAGRQQRSAPTAARSDPLSY